MFCFCILAPISKVLFEITLSREWIKLLSCSISSKNYILYIQNFYCHFQPFFEAESGAKVRRFFVTSKLLPKFFLKIFRRTLFKALPRTVILKSECKVKPFFYPFQIFRNLFFSLFYSLTLSNPSKHLNTTHINPQTTDKLNLQIYVYYI